jgi:hypothetical protein
VGPVMLMSVPIVLNRQRCELVGSVWKEILKELAVGLDQRYRLGSTSKVVLGRVYPAAEREDDRAKANCLDIMLRALILLP